MAKRAESGGNQLPSEVARFLDGVWESLRRDVPAKRLTSTDRLVGKQLIDEQDAGHRQQLANFYYYAVSHLIIGLRETNARSYDAVLEEALEQCDSIASEEFFAERGGKALILSRDDERAIAVRPVRVAEREQQAADARIAGSITSWEFVSRAS